MITLWSILGLVLIYKILSVDSNNPYYLRRQMIKRGATSTVQENEFPYIVGIYHNPTSPNATVPKCLGIITSNHTVLTTATCASDEWGNHKAFPRSLTVRYNIREGCDIHNSLPPRLVRNIVYHPLSNASDRFADLAYLITYDAILEKDVDPPTKEQLKIEDSSSSTKDFLKIPEIAQGHIEDPSALSCIFFGFVKEMEDDVQVHRLTYRHFTFAKLTACIAAYSKVFLPITSDKMCGGFPANGMVPTLNDSGAPVLCEHGGSGPMIYGLNSFTSVNGTVPGNFVNLSIYLDFVEEARKAGEDINAELNMTSEDSKGRKLNNDYISLFIACSIFLIL